MIFLARKTNPSVILFWGNVDNQLRTVFSYASDLSEVQKKYLERYGWFNNWYNELLVDFYALNSLEEIKNNYKNNSLFEILEWLNDQFVLVEIKNNKEEIAWAANPQTLNLSPQAHENLHNLLEKKPAIRSRLAEAARRK